MKNITRILFALLVVVACFSTNVVAQDASLTFPISSTTFAAGAVQNATLPTEVDFFNTGCAFSSSSYGTNCPAGTTGYTMRADNNTDFLCIKTPSNTIGRIDITIMANSTTAANAVVGYSADSITWANFQEIELPATNAIPSCLTHSLYPPAGTKYFKLARAGFDGYTPVGVVGQTVRIFNIAVWCSGSASIKGVKTTIVDFNIAPNPAQTSTAITYSTSEEVSVVLTVTAISGETLATLVDDVQGAGEYSVDYTCSNLPKGAYIVTLKAGSTQVSKKLIKN